MNHKPPLQTGPNNDRPASADTANRLRRSRVNVSPADIAKVDVGVRLVGKDELRVAFGSVARTRVSAVHPVHEVAVAVPDGEDEDRPALESAALGVQTSEAKALGALGVAVFLGIVSLW
jgi:hypothetical protein